MIVNIPLQIDEEVIEKSISTDYQHKIEDYIFSKIDDALKKRAREVYKYYSGHGTTDEGMSSFVYTVVEKYIQVWKPEIIEVAAEKLAERLAKTKAAKELLSKE